MFSTDSEDILKLPDHWIGVNSRWREVTDEPWDYLVSMPPTDLATHAYFLGATGSGKTTLIHHLIAQDIKLGASICVVDMRGDLVRATIELAADRVDPAKVRVIDLREKDYVSGFNPLHGNGEAYFRALSVLDAVANESESWGVQLSETLRNALLLLAEVGKPVTALEKLFFDRDFRDHCLANAESQPLREFWQRFDTLGPDRQNGLAGPVLNKVSLLLATKTLRSILGHPTPFDLEKHLNTKGSITLVSLAADELHGAARMFGSLMIASISREIFARIPIPESQRNPVRLYVDEFEHFGTHLFEPILAEGRKFKLEAVLAHQTLAQLTPKMRSLILGNVGVKAIFRCGREDGSVLSRDLFGDLKAYDFADQSVGHCVLWRKNQGALEVEVNAPLLTNAGQLSKSAEAYLRRIYAKCEPAPDEETPERSETRIPLRIVRSDTEDWLCG